MSNEKILSWCLARENMGRKYDFFSDLHYKITFENGEQYEYKRENMKNNQYNVKIWINGEMVQNALYRDGWLKNGNYGAEKLEELPIEKAA